MSSLRSLVLAAATQRITDKVLGILAERDAKLAAAHGKRPAGFVPGISGSLRRLALKRLGRNPRAWADRYERAGISEEFWWRLVEAFGGRCAYCSVACARLTIDHVTPRFENGVGGEDDILPACGKCNSRKQHRTVSWLLAKLERDEDEFWGRVREARAAARLAQSHTRARDPYSRRAD